MGEESADDIIARHKRLNPGPPPQGDDDVWRIATGRIPQPPPETWAERGARRIFWRFLFIGGALALGVAVDTPGLAAMSLIAVFIVEAMTRRRPSAPPVTQSEYVALFDQELRHIEDEFAQKLIEAGQPERGARVAVLFDMQQKPKQYVDLAHARLRARGVRRV